MVLDSLLVYSPGPGSSPRPFQQRKVHLMTAVFQCDTVDLDKESCIDHVQQARVLKVSQSLSQIITEGHLIGCCSSIGMIVSSMLLPKCRIPPVQNSLMS